MTASPPPTSNTIRFEDGAGYERMMGAWSRLVGTEFLDWLQPPAGARWLDVGCGNGAFTELIVDRTAPLAVSGIDPSEAQLAYARGRPAARLAQFSAGGAETLPWPDAHFDAAVMALVIFFVPEPARALAEMRRVVRPGGLVAAYAWDMPGGGFPLASLQQVMHTAGLPVPMPPGAEVSRREALQALWQDGGLADVHSREIVVQRGFRDFAELWEVSQFGSSIRAALPGLDAAARDALRSAWRQQLGVGEGEPLTLSARANAVAGRVPAA